MLEAYGFLEEECLKLDQAAGLDDSIREALQTILEGKSALHFIKSAKQEVLEERATSEVLKRMIDLLLVIIHQDTVDAAKILA
jgi:hypothetical protein